jgi:hypothetical protein
MISREIPGMEYRGEAWRVIAVFGREDALEDFQNLMAVREGLITTPFGVL